VETKAAGRQIAIRQQRERTIMSFRITGLPAQNFAHLFALSDAELAAQGAVRRTADARTPGYPCRVSLTDSRPGDELLLVNYEHHAVDSPYRMRFAIFVRKGEQTYDRIDAVPEQLRLRTLAVRAFDAAAMMVAFELVDGRDLEQTIERMLAMPYAAYLHIHFAAPGCYAARVERA
jgi:uncharacterized protein DUF1203